MFLVDFSKSGIESVRESQADNREAVCVLWLMWFLLVVLFLLTHRSGGIYVQRMTNGKVTCFLSYSLIHSSHKYTGGDAGMRPWLLYILFINTLEAMLEWDLGMPSFLYFLDFPQQGVLNVLLLFQKPLEKC